MKHFYLPVIALLLLLIPAVGAQDDTTTDTTTDEQGSTVNYFFVACESQAVFDLTGNMLNGFDLYVQVFRDAGATGTALSPVTRVNVDGGYQVSPIVQYTGGETLLLGQFASARISIAPTGNPDNPVYTDVVDDVQDTCIEPSYSAADTSDAGSSTGGGTLIDPETGEVIEGSADEPIRSSGIYTPGGGVLNEVFGRPQEALVQIGARPSENERIEGRTTDPGLIFAECDAFPLANPGRLFDTDNLTVFWSWFAATPALAREHIARAQFEVFLTSEYAYRQVFPNVDVRPVVQREDGNYYVFYVANLGDGFRPGEYRIDYYVTWPEIISDGYGEFGPGTDTPFLKNTCTFEVEINPFGIRTDLNNPTIPLQSGN